MGWRLPAPVIQEGTMEQPLDELNDASYRLMLDIQTGRMVNTPRPIRGRLLLGLVTVMLGGLAGLLLASGNRTQETTDLPQAPGSIFAVRPPQPLSKRPQDLTDSFVRSSTSWEDTTIADEPLEEPGSADIQPSSDRKAAPRIKSPSSSSLTTSAPKPPSAHSMRVSKPSREPDRRGKDLSQRFVQRRSLQLSTRSVESDFDPNAERVRTSP
jgi:hypothetical protein